MIGNRTGTCSPAPRVALTLVCALAAAGLTPLSGCTVLLDPDRDAIVDFDAAVDGGMDGGDADAGDAGDAGDGGQCVDPPPENCSTQTVDEDCDGFAGCADFDCVSASNCCIVGDGADLPASFNSSNWNLLPADAGTMLSTAEVRFEAPGAAILNRCVPLAYGARFSMQFRFSARRAGEFAAFGLGPLDVLGGDGQFLSELAVVISGEGTVHVERAGSMIGTPVDVDGNEVDVTVAVSPGVDGAGRAVLAATVRINGALELDAEPIMPLADLRGQASGCVPDGLFAALSGRGNGVRVEGPGVTIDLFECPNPQQFLRDTALDMFQPLADQLPTGGDVPPSMDWRMGGVGEPSLTQFLDVDVSTLEFWADGAREPRSSSIIRPPDFASNGAIYTGDDFGTWTARVDSLTVAGAREPSIVAPPGVSSRYLAFAREQDGAYEIAVRSFAPVASTPDTGSDLFVLDPTMLAECQGLRDPALASLDGENHFLLLFTCDRGLDPNTIGAAQLARVAGGMYRAESMTADVFDGLVQPAHAAGGVSSPELVVTPLDGNEFSLRMWYLARGDDTTVGFAYARLDLNPMSVEDGGVDGGMDAGADGGPAGLQWSRLPVFAPFAGNPVLAGDNPLLGSQETCVRGCDIESLAVLNTLDTHGPWRDEPVYLLLIDRTRYDTEGIAIHELVGLTQVRPAN